jgi:Na+-driven multidrug efflux pump
MQRARATFLICSLLLLPVVALAVVLVLLDHPIGAAIAWLGFAILTAVLAIARSRIFRKAREASSRPDA